MKLLRSVLPSLLILASALNAQTNPLTNAKPANVTGPAVVIVTPAGRMDFAKLRTGVELVQTPDGFELAVVFPTSKLPDEEYFAQLFTGDTIALELPSEPESDKALVITRNGVTLALGHDYSLNGLVLAFVPANAPQAGDLFTFRYKKKAGSTPAQSTIGGDAR
ncbi:MAG: hypothetical protein IT163_13065 [Bryobacterales bacterium]|nr:hypothetical protein [Bryobacterales bacterium]